MKGLMGLNESLGFGFKGLGLEVSGLMFMGF